MVEKIVIGDVARDKITKFEGVVVSRTEWINGCVRLQLQPRKLDKDGKPGDYQAFDIEQLELVKAKVVVPSRPHGGPMPSVERLKHPLNELQRSRMDRDPVRR